MVFLAILLATSALGSKVISIMVNKMQFQEGIESVARFASVNRQNADHIRPAILKEAQNNEIPIAAEDIHVKGAGGHVIAADHRRISMDSEFSSLGQKQSHRVAFCRPDQMALRFAASSANFAKRVAGGF